ncbi:MAG TPA: hypothetical protein DCL54_08700 [Alphaproteobacteria bacterium]|nr:hypothetical protein [Alphaproteobacteria bacterium]
MTPLTQQSAPAAISSARAIARKLQVLQALIFLGLGGWCLFAPHTVERLALKPDYQHLSATTALLIGCFGAQAVLCGSLMLVAHFTARTFLVFGLLASLPFFVFNVWFVWVAEMFTAWMLVDFAGNLSFLLIGIVGWRLLRDETEPT